MTCSVNLLVPFSFCAGLRVTWIASDSSSIKKMVPQILAFQPLLIVFHRLGVNGELFRHAQKFHGAEVLELELLVQKTENCEASVL